MASEPFAPSRIGLGWQVLERGASGFTGWTEGLRRTQDAAALKRMYKAKRPDDVATLQVELAVEGALEVDEVGGLDDDEEGEGDAGGVEQVAAQLRIARDQRLPVVQALCGHLARMVHPHQRHRAPARGFRQLGGGRCRSGSRCRTFGQCAQPIGEAADQAVGSGILADGTVHARKPVDDRRQ